jgi:hypothetical protein
VSDDLSILVTPVVALIIGIVLGIIQSFMEDDQ